MGKHIAPDFKTTQPSLDLKFDSNLYVFFGRGLWGFSILPTEDYRVESTAKMSKKEMGGYIAYIKKEEEKNQKQTICSLKQTTKKRQKKSQSIPEVS